ncbi:hypothetical protein Tco_0517170, partial [Tanacetum coccineum]
EDRHDVAGPSHPAGTKLSTYSFYVLQEMDSETLRQIYVLKWNVVNESVLDDPDRCRSLTDQLVPTPHTYFSLSSMVWTMISYSLSLMLGRHVKRVLVLRSGLSHPDKAETRGVTSWISSQHNGVNNR